MSVVTSRSSTESTDTTAIFVRMTFLFSNDLIINTYQQIKIICAKGNHFLVKMNRVSLQHQLKRNYLSIQNAFIRQVMVQNLQNT